MGQGRAAPRMAILAVLAVSAGLVPAVAPATVAGSAPGDRSAPARVAPPARSGPGGPSGGAFLEPGRRYGRLPPAPPAAPGPASAPVPPPAPTAFEAGVTPLPPDVATAMTGVSWRPECPVPLSALRLVRLAFWGFDGAVHRGELVVNADIADSTVRVFRAIFDARFPIRQMRRVEAYGGSDTASMADDNTSGFNCRRLTGSTAWSKHAYGLAIDVNTVENPYLHDGLIEPPAGGAYLDRRVVRPGMIVAGDPVTRAFVAAGFTWGGDFTSIKDYQHFQKA